jgi:tRNA-2-methylthio-N6-dimethylallyladenosine synthase
MKYYIWTIGCQMNRAESAGLAHTLDSYGFEQVKTAREADVVLINTCVVRQNAEDKVTGMLGYLKGIKGARPHMLIAVTGCFVDSDIKKLANRYPHVNCFFQPGEIRPFEDWVLAGAISNAERNAETRGPASAPVSAFIPIIQGCNNFCSYCIVPYRRGRERSRPPEEIMMQAESYVVSGAREIVLLGQNVNTYGKDLGVNIDLASLLARLNSIPGLFRIRFLTNHPKDMSDELINALSCLSKVCHHICLPLQAGDDQVLKAMNRHYSVAEYRALVDKIRCTVPDIALSTDIIVGFPGESEDQFQNTFRAIAEIGFDVVHVAAYSPREGTSASEQLPDDVPYETKMRRLHEIETLQTAILSAKNSILVGRDLEILVEGKKGPKWYGRTYSDKLVFFDDGLDRTGELAMVHVQSSTPWALQGSLIPT